MSSRPHRGPPRGGPGKPPPAKHPPAVAPGGAKKSSKKAGRDTGKIYEEDYDRLGLPADLRPIGWQRRPKPVLTQYDSGQEGIENDFVDYRALRPPFWFTHRDPRMQFLRKFEQNNEKFTNHDVTTYYGDIFSNDPYDWTGILIDNAWMVRGVRANEEDIWKQYSKFKIANNRSFLFYKDKDPVRVQWHVWLKEGYTVENYLVKYDELTCFKRFSRDDFFEKMYARVRYHGQIVDTGLTREHLVFKVQSSKPEFARREAERWDALMNDPDFKQHITDCGKGFYKYLTTPGGTPPWGFRYITNESGERVPTWVDFDKLFVHSKQTKGNHAQHGPAPEYYLDRLYDFWTKKHRNEIHDEIPTIPPDRPDSIPPVTPLDLERVKNERFTHMAPILAKVREIRENKPLLPERKQAAGGHHSDEEQRSPATDQPSASGIPSTTNEPRASGSGGRNSGNQDTQSPQLKTSSEERRGGQQPQADSRGRLPSPTRRRSSSGSRHSGPRSPSPPVNPPSSPVAGAASNTGTGNVTHPPQHTTGSLVPPDPQGYIYSNRNFEPIYSFPEEPGGNICMFYSHLRHGKPVFQEGYLIRATGYVTVTMDGVTRYYPTRFPDPAPRRGGKRAPTSHSRKRRHPNERDRSESPLRSRRSDSTEPSDKRTKK